MAGQNLTNGLNHLAMQSNCDLVLYHGGKPAWNTNTNTTANATAGSGSCYAVLKQNGELVVRRNVHYILWTSAKKAKKGKYALVLDGAGRIGIYGQRRWVSNNQKEEVHELSRPVVSTEYVLQSGGHWRLSPGKKLKYREYELGLSRCNLEINSTRTGRTLWQTNTKAASCFVELESNGELMVKRGSQRLWSSGRKGERGKYVAVLRFDGRLAVYGSLLWSNAQWDDYSSIKEEMMTWAMGQ
ncbi:Mannose-specific lectin 1 [Apostasia shenzhenica]|uniref:Mannose-specific lectin 1 n=1 Tax=Apostasia shenzhenica TaxID=1088818 RepID=A0A2I0AAB1_9ASPA|nr:Mannose-specific lectin 1 [Apostasia shenzhenica]